MMRLPALLAMALVSGVTALTGFAGCRCTPPPPARIHVVIEQPGASALEMEERVAVRVEEALASLAGLARISARSTPGRAVITLQLDAESSAPAAMGTALGATRARVAAVQRDLPASASPPLVVRGDAVPALRFVAHLVSETGPAARTTGAELTRMLEGVAQQIERVPGVDRVDVENAQRESVVIELDGARTTALGLAFTDVRDAIEAAANADGGAAVLVRDTARVGQIVIRAGPDGTITRVSDVGSVTVVVEPDAGADPWRRAPPRPSSATPSVDAAPQSLQSLLVWRQAGAGVADVQRDVVGALAAASAQLPKDLRLTREPFAVRDEFLVVVALARTGAVDTIDAVSVLHDGLAGIPGAVVLDDMAATASRRASRRIDVDRERAADLAVRIEDVFATLAPARVGPLVLETRRDQDISALRVRATNGALVPLVDVITLADDATADLLERRDRRPVVTTCVAVAVAVAPGAIGGGGARRHRQGDRGCVREAATGRGRERDRGDGLRLGAAGF